MHYVGYAEMAAAVSNAGGLGLITALTITANGGPEALRKEIQKCRTLTSKPFGVNCTLLPVGVPPDWPAIIQVIIDEKITVVETAGRAPDEIVKKFKDNGIIVMHKCVTIRHAIAAAKRGVDVISMDGFDCAGHPGQAPVTCDLLRDTDALYLILFYHSSHLIRVLTLQEDCGNWILLAAAGKKLPIPFIASGGVGTGSQLAAALSMGAIGINMGTRFMATQECPIKDGIKQALVDGDHNSTMLVMRSVGNTERVFKNEVTEKVAQIEEEFPGDFSKIHPYVAGVEYKKSFHETGDPNSSVWSCGQVMALIEDVPTCQVLLDRIMSEAEEIISKNAAVIVSKSKL